MKRFNGMKKIGVTMMASMMLFGTLATSVSADTNVQANTNVKVVEVKDTRNVKHDRDVKEFKKWLNANFNCKLEINAEYNAQVKYAALNAWKKFYWLDGGIHPAMVREDFILRVGDWGKGVYFLKGMLICKGYDCTFNDKFDEKTEKELKKFEKKEKIAVDGVCDKNTWNHLFK